MYFLHIYSNTHDDKQDLTRVSDNSGYERLLTYDGPHNITSRIKKASGDHYTECLYEYDGDGNMDTTRTHFSTFLTTSRNYSIMKSVRTDC